MTRQETGHIFEEGLLRLNRVAGQEEIRNDCRICLHRREQRQELADLRTEGEAGRVQHIVERLDAEAIAGGKYGVIDVVIDGK